MKGGGLARSEELGAPTFPGRSNWIGMKFGGVLGVVEFWSTPNSQPNWRTSSWTKGVAEIFAIGRSGALFLYLEMPARIGETQGVGEYCGGVY